MTDSTQKAFDSFNDHQKDNKGRATLLASYALALAAGTFTASVTVFSSRAGSQLPLATVKYLHDGWYSLFLAIATLFLFLTLIIVRDYFSAEAWWRPRLSGGEAYLPEKIYTRIIISFEILIFSAGLFGLSSLCFGLYKIMYAVRILIN